jgi:hypothetical protein
MYSLCFADEKVVTVQDEDDDEEFYLLGYNAV